MKKLTALILACLLMLSAVCVSAYSSGQYKNGDVNRDGYTTIQDANAIQRYLANMISFDSVQSQLGDYNLSGNVSIDDVTEIQMVLVRGKQAPVEDQPAPNPKVNSNVTVYFSNNDNWNDVYYYVYKSSDGTEQYTWPGKKINNYTLNNEGERVYSDVIDTSVYDRIIFNNGVNSNENDNKQTINVMVNKASSGFYISDNSSAKAMLVGTYAYDSNICDKGTLTIKKFAYPKGYEKRVWIWLPSDYKADGDKFRTLYLLDGQNLFDIDHEDGYGGWEVTDAVESMMTNGGRGVIIVGIESTPPKDGSDPRRRDKELTPDLGSLNPLLPYDSAKDFEIREGIEYADFVANTVMPYVQSNYNSSVFAEDNMIAGSSSGGIESFYIGMEYNEKFGMIGALSPAFLLFDDTVWNNYLSKFDLASDDMPKLYLFNGNNGVNEYDTLEQNLRIFCVQMYERLKKAGYKNMTLTLEDSFMHNEAYWRVVFPECISYLLDI